MKWGCYKFFCILVLLSFEMLALAFQKKETNLKFVAPDLSDIFLHFTTTTKRSGGL